MALGEKKKTGKTVSGSQHAGGNQALSFKQGSVNHTETTRSVNRDSDPLRSAPERPKPIDPSQQTRGQAESMSSYMKRRRANRGE